MVANQVVNNCLKDPVLGTKINIETGDVVEWCPSLLGKLLSPILGPEPANAGVNVFKVGLEKSMPPMCVNRLDGCNRRFGLFVHPEIVESVLLPGVSRAVLFGCPAVCYGYRLVGSSRFLLAGLCRYRVLCTHTKYSISAHAHRG